MIDIVKVVSYMQRCYLEVTRKTYQKTMITVVNMYIHAVCPIVMPALYRDVLSASPIVVILISIDMIITWIILPPP
jgi:hypothetical protein